VPGRRCTGRDITPRGCGAVLRFQECCRDDVGGRGYGWAGSLEGLLRVYDVRGVSGEGIQEICEGASRSYKTDEKEGYDVGVIVKFVHIGA
jgi:hypothetical protein